MIIKLDTKYRPVLFDDVIGQEALVKILRAIVRKAVYESAYMFSGPSGVGKTTLGRIFSMAILCDNPQDGNPCGECESCVSFLQEANFGYKELDAASFGGKEDMIRLRDDASFQSVSKKKIILLDECHDISKSGQDALLKQTEQCPEHLIYIFCTTEPERMNGTLRGRCMEFQASRVDKGLVINRLKKICDQEGIAYQDDGLRTIVAETHGQVRDAIKLMEQVSYVGEVSMENLRSVSKNYDEEVCGILANLGRDLGKSLDCAKRVSSFIPVFELYGLILSMLSDTSKLIYGCEDFEKERKKYLEELKDIHGYALLEFLNYLITRDKFVNKIGLQSDIVLLHYKFGSQAFKPQVNVTPKELPEQKIPVTEKTAESAPPKVREQLSHTQLSKMSLKERTQVLREQRRAKRDGEQKETEQVPQNWPLPKEQRIGESSIDEKELPPEEFSKLLVGGRGG